MFDGNTVIENGCATPSVADCDDTVKPFGASVFRIQGKNDEPYGCFTPVKDGLLFFDCPADGGGNLFLYHTDTNEIEPLYYSNYGYKPDGLTLYSAVETKDGIYYIEETGDGKMDIFHLYLLPADSGAYTPGYSKIILGDADGDGKMTINDATMIQKYLAEFDMPDNFVLKACDVNGDGYVTISDVTAIQRYLAEMDAPEGIGKPIA